MRLPARYRDVFFGRYMLIRDCVGITLLGTLLGLAGLVLARMWGLS